MPNKEQIKGRVKEGAGKAEGKAGEMTGDREREGRGRGRELEGKVEKTAGDMKDKAKSVIDKMRGK